MSGFTAEQMAMAKQLQASFGPGKNSQSCRPASGKKAATLAMPPPVVRPPPARRPIQMQPGSALSTSNGLVRPLPSNSFNSPFTVVPASRPVYKPASTQTSDRVIQNTIPERSPVQFGTPPAVRANPPSQPVAIASLPIQLPLKPAPIDLLSLEPLEPLSTPALAAQPVLQCLETTTGCNAALRKQHTTVIVPKVEIAQDSGRLHGVDDVCNSIRNYASGAPALCELSAEELGETEASPTLIMGSHGQTVPGSSAARVPRPVIGLKGSRHAH